MQNKLPTIKDNKEVLKDIIAALEELSTNYSYSVVLNWRLVIPNSLTTPQVCTFTRKLLDAVSLMKDEYISDIELRISEYDQAGVELFNKVKEIRNAKAPQEPEKEEKQESAQEPEQPETK